MLQPLHEVSATPTQRVFTTAVLDIATSGGLPAGGSTLIAGAPGAGKSTLLTQAACEIPFESFYFTGEEKVESIATRAERMGLKAKNLKVAATNSADEIACAIIGGQPAMCVVDSIQMMTVASCRGAAGSPSQLRAVTEKLCHAARFSGTALVLVCHENKDGGFAGPRTVEHMVDVTIRIERDPEREIVVVKNRHGNAPLRVAVEMTKGGLQLTPEGAEFAGEWLQDRAAAMVKLDAWVAAGGRREMLAA